MITNTGAGERLRKLRLQQNKTMDKVVNEFNEQFGTSISRSNVSRWESGENEPSLSMAKRLCAYYGITADYLLGLEEPTNGDS